MGLEKPQLVGQVAIRGMAVFPDGHKYEAKTHYFVGKGVRFSIFPMSATKVYWFVNVNSCAQGMHP